ncbi:beta-propeller domain-containing protein [Patescibacteria group bacterium]|nr:beta-propeller domain-containing protein [Patescibacteria group bacterium]MBU1722041.1 beta-propeller domain-containing protein [Patescibacteria group bacterium]
MKYTQYIGIACVVLLLSGCSLLGKGESVTQKSIETTQVPKAVEDGAQKISSVTELQALFDSTLNNEMGGNGYYRNFAIGDMEIMPMAMEATTGLGSGAVMKSSADFSDTNLQEADVDEADMIKTNGEYIYMLADKDLSIVKAYPAESAELVATVRFENAPQDMYITDDNHLVILGEKYRYGDIEPFFRRSYYGASPESFLKVFDVVDPKNPKEIRDVVFEGNYKSSRMIGNYVYMLTDNYGFQYDGIEMPLPRVFDNGIELVDDCAEEQCLFGSLYYFDIPYRNYTFTGLAAVNVVDVAEDITRETYVLEDTQEVYVSEHHAYVTYTERLNENEVEYDVMLDYMLPKLPVDVAQKIEKIQMAESYILNEYEKQDKVSDIIYNEYILKLSDDEQMRLDDTLEEKVRETILEKIDELEVTQIHKIALDGSDINYLTSGVVKGYVNNQFSMDEEKGYFRIATTKGQLWSHYLDKEERKSYNNVYVLDEDLTVVGSVEELASDERIYSVRFMQDRAYIVTFKQVDPLFAIDLKDPRNPKVLGELKVPGFSKYLHPYDDNTLIGFGQETEETEWGGVRTGGLKVSLFDVSDVNNLKELDTLILGDSGSYSEALYNHKAFMFSKEKEMIAVPLTLREKTGDREWSSLYFQGAAIISVDGKSLSLKGKITHADKERCGEAPTYNRCYNDANVKRILYIGDNLYTLSSEFMKVNAISDLEEVKSLNLLKRVEKEDDFEVII